MTQLLGDSIVSALGFTSEENYLNVKNGVSGLRFVADRYAMSEPFMASEIDVERLEEEFGTAIKEWGRMSSDGYSKLEKAAIVSVVKALKQCAISPASDRTLFVISTTKGNIECLSDGLDCFVPRNDGKGDRLDCFVPRNDGKADVFCNDDRLYLWRSAEKISRFFGNRNNPLVVSNACISGASAIIAARRELKAGRYDTVIVTGVDVLSEFIISGFQSFKALSQEVCKPFDANRNGLNLGEGAATMILTESNSIEGVEVTSGAVRNDANHISGPSRTGEGAYLALQSAVKDVNINEIAFTNAHGTATQYNDEMESVALARAGLQDVPVNSLKGYFGHTLGAAGILESIISVYALKDGIILATYGFETSGVTYPIKIVKTPQPTTKRRFVKMLSGFGGCNAALLFTYNPDSEVTSNRESPARYQP